ncbi:MAG: preprotein translocase subunit YajC [Alphaproteobacteria bacterium]|jgi:preprotein translocase subunit YajC|nr:preprotein translocase subunit YajC [Alphaproteobacteria bacterium]
MLKPLGFLGLLLAIPAAQADAGAGAPSAIVQFVPFIAIFALMYFLILRPNQKREKERQAMIAALKRGDRVVTSGGILGTVHKIVSNEEVVLEIAEDVRVRVQRGAVSQVLSKTEPVRPTAGKKGEESVSQEDEDSSPKEEQDAAGDEKQSPKVVTTTRRKKNS